MTQSITLPIKILPHGEGLPVPAYQTELAAGFDIMAAIDENENRVIAPGHYEMIPSGFAIELPAHFEAQVRPRSGLAAKHGVTVLNSPGTIDADYRGEVKVILINHGKEPFQIKRGMRIAQIVIQQVKRATLTLTTELSESARSEGGFGSTGTK